MGPATVLIKRGEYGVLQFSDEGMFAVPAYPLEEVVDPTGAGDTFAGAMMGFIARHGRVTESSLRTAVVYGSVLGVVRGRAFLAGKAFGFDLGRDRQSLSRVYQLNRLTSFEMDYSVVIPLYNERDSLGPLHEELSRVMQSLGRTYELIFVDDGSTDGSIEALRQIKSADKNVRAISLARNSGQTAALACGFSHAAGDIIIAMDADGQNDPADIPRLLAKLDEGYDLASGWRTERWQEERLTRRLPSMAANSLISAMTGVKLHDYGCTFKAYRRDLARSLQLYGEMHRFVPAIAAEQGARIAEVEIGFRPRRAGISKYGLWRIVRTLLDLDHRKIPLGLFHRADSSVRLDRNRARRTRQPMDLHPGVRESTTRLRTG